MGQHSNNIGKINKSSWTNAAWNQCCPIFYDAGPTLSQHWFIGLCYRAGQHHDGATYCQIGQIGLASSNSFTIFKDSSNAANTRFWPTVGQLWSSLAGPSCLGLISLFSDHACLSVWKPKVSLQRVELQEFWYVWKGTACPPPSLRRKDHTVVNNAENVVNNKIELVCSTQLRF